MDAQDVAQPEGFDQDHEELVVKFVHKELETFRQLRPIRDRKV